MLFRNIALLDENFNLQTAMFVGVKAGKIAYIGATEPADAAEYTETYDGTGKLLLPGFINAHAHTPMTLLRGYGENLPLNDWLHTRIFPFEACLTDDDVHHATLLGCAEMLASGTTSATDMYSNGVAMATAILQSGMKNNLSLGVTAFTPDEYRRRPIFAENEMMFREYHNAGDGRLKFELSVHGEYTTNPQTVSAIIDHAKQLGVGIHVHVSETQSEHEECKLRHNGMTPVQYFDSLGMFDVPVNVAHGVWLEQCDMDILAAKGATVVSNPVSNLKLASGIAPVLQMMESGVNVALGTDSVASNNNLSMIEEMKFFALLAKGKTLRADVVSPADALRAATVNGAFAQRRSDTGVIKVGFAADLTVLDISAVHMQPMYDITANVVYSANNGDVKLTMVDGKVLYRNGEFTTIDIERALYNVERSKLRILSELAGK